MIRTPNVGDVWAVNTGDSFAADLIRFGERLQGKPDETNHVVIVSHVDARSHWWGIEGRPGGVGWVDLARYTNSPYARYGNSNFLQVRTPIQREAIAKAARGLLQVKYDWVGGIGADVLNTFDLHQLSDALDELYGAIDPRNPHVEPGHVVCSSLAAWVYRALGINGPSHGVFTEQIEPADWFAFNKPYEEQPVPS